MYDCIVEESVRSCVAQGGVGCHMDVVVVAVAHLEHVNMTCDTFYLSHAIHSTCHMLIMSSPDQTACQPPEGCRGSGWPGAWLCLTGTTPPGGGSHSYSLLCNNSYEMPWQLQFVTWYYQLPLLCPPHRTSPNIPKLCFLHPQCLEENGLGEDPGILFEAQQVLSAVMFICNRSEL